MVDWPRLIRALRDEPEPEPVPELSDIAELRKQLLGVLDTMLIHGVTAEDMCHAIKNKYPQADIRLFRDGVCIHYL